MIVRNSPFPSQPGINPQNDNKTIKEKEKSESIQTTENTMLESTPKSDKVSDIKQQIDNGTYKIDINKTADKMAQDLLLDIRVYKDSRGA